MDQKLKIMLAQLNPTVGDLEKNSNTIMETYSHAVQKQIDILAFPEMFLSGYQLQDLVLKKHFKKMSKFSKILTKKCISSTYLLLVLQLLKKENYLMHVAY